jgi:hypothetical protein
VAEKISSRVSVQEVEGLEELTILTAVKKEPPPHNKDMEEKSLE